MLPSLFYHSQFTTTTHHASSTPPQLQYNLVMANVKRIILAITGASGAVIFPPIPAFYQRPKTIDDLADATVGRMLSRIGIENDLAQPWGE